MGESLTNWCIYITFVFAHELLSLSSNVKDFSQNIWQWTRRNTDDTLGDHKILKGSMDYLHLQWKFKSLVGKFASGVKAKHCFWKQKVCRHHQAKFCLLPQVNFPANNLSFQWRWKWWDWIQAILNLLYFTNDKFLVRNYKNCDKNLWKCWCMETKTKILLQK